MRPIIQKRKTYTKVSSAKNSNDLASYHKTGWAFAVNHRPVVGLLPVQKRPSTPMDKK